MTKIYNYHITNFIISVTDICFLPNDSNSEIIFTGYSNVGKSSVLNTLTNNKKLAKTSKIPGCTRLINLFEVEPGIRLIDFPGYGYSIMPKTLKKKWHYVINFYLKKRKNIVKGLVLLMDISYPMKYLDKLVINYAINNNVPILILLNKADKLSYFTRQKQIVQVKKMIILTFKKNIQIEFFSSKKKQGLKELNKTLNFWLS